METRHALSIAPETGSHGLACWQIAHRAAVDIVLMFT